jgi:ferredoxin-fold anticodon binding domain-containing protein
MERRRSGRKQIQVDIEISGVCAGRCHGYAENIGRNGVSIVLESGNLAQQRAVLLSFRVWTGSEYLLRKIYARIIRQDMNVVAFEFADKDIIADAIVQDLIYYQRRLHGQSQLPLKAGSTASEHTTTG